MVWRVLSMGVFLLGLASFAAAQSQRWGGNAPPLSFEPVPAPMDAGAIVTAARAWALDEANDDLRRDLVAAIRDALARALPDSTARTYELDELCGFVSGSGGVSKLDGGGGTLGVVNPFEFDRGRDVVGLDRFGDGAIELALPGRLVVVDAFDFAGWRVPESAGASARTPILGFEASRSWASETEVPHGNVVVSHVAALLGAQGFVLRSIEVLGGGDGPDARLLFEFESSAAEAFSVDLYDVDYDHIRTIEAALRAVAATASDPGPAAVVLSWGLTDCPLRDAYVAATAGIGWAERISASTHLADFTAMVVATYDEVVRQVGATPVTDLVCAAVDEASGHAVTTASTAGCTVPAVRALVGTTVLFASYERTAATWAAGLDSVFHPAHAYYGAAGNERLPYPMPPGSFESVLAVAACKPVGPERAPFSNAGDGIEVLVDGVKQQVEAIALGAWFPASGGTRAGDAVGYWGTSYAAPLAALDSGWPRTGGPVPTFDRLCAPWRWPLR